MKIASTRSTTASNWCCWPATAPGRSRQGAPITVDRDNDKNPVVALREIADETLSPDDLKEDLIHSLQKHVEVDEPEADGQEMTDQAGAATAAADAERRRRTTSPSTA